MTTNATATTATRGSVLVDSIGTRWVVLSAEVQSSHITVIEEADEARLQAEAEGDWIDRSLYTRRVRVYKDDTIRHHKGETPWTLA